MKFTQQITAADYISANRIHSRFSVRFFLGLFSFFLLVSWFLWNEKIVDFVLPTFCIGFIVYIFLWKYLFVPYQTRRIFTQHKKLHYPYEYEISDRGFSVTGGGDHSFHEWSEIFGWKGDQNMVLIYLTESMFVMLLKKSFTNVEDFDVFKSDLEKYGVSIKKDFDWNKWKYILPFLILLWIVAGMAGYFGFFQ